MTEVTVSRLLDAGPPPAPGGWRSALYRPDAPGAVLDSQEWARSWPAFMRAITNPNDASARRYIANAMSERLPSGGGFLVPEILRSQVLEYMSAAIVRPQAMVLPMASERLVIPVLDNLTQASETQALGGLGFSWTEESAGITPSIPSFAAVALEARKAAAYMQGVANEFIFDASGAFGDFMTRVLGLGYSWFEDDSWINGTGVGEPQGLINAPCAVAVTRASGGLVQQADIATMFKSLHPAAKMYGFTPGLTNVRWLISATVMDQILELYLAIGTPTNTAVAPSGWFQAGDGDKVGPNMLGLPVTVTDHQPAAGSKGDVILADLAQFVIGDRMAMTIERSTESPGAFGSDSSNFRIKSRVDGRYWVQSSTTTEASQHVSPVVVLVLGGFKCRVAGHVSRVAHAGGTLRKVAPGSDAPVRPAARAAGMPGRGPGRRASRYSKSSASGARRIRNASGRRTAHGKRPIVTVSATIARGTAGCCITGRRSGWSRNGSPRCGMSRVAAATCAVSRWTWKQSAASSWITTVPTAAGAGPAANASSASRATAAMSAAAVSGMTLTGWSAPLLRAGLPWRRPASGSTASPSRANCR